MATQEAVYTAQTCDGIRPIFTQKECCPIHPTYPGTDRPYDFPNVCLMGGVGLAALLLLLIVA